MSPVQVVAGVAVRGDTVLLIRSRKHGVATPGGKVHPGETHEDALRREMREETGLEIVRFGRYLHTDRQPTYHCHLYAIEVSGGDPVAGDDAAGAWWGDPAEILRSQIPRDYPLVLDVMRRGVGPFRVYIAGPIALGDRAANIRAGIDAGEAVLRAGMTPFVPFLNEAWHEQHPHTHAEWMAFDLQWLECCGAVLRLPGESRGADIETAHARARGIPVFATLEALVAWSRGGVQ